MIRIFKRRARLTCHVWLQRGQRRRSGKTSGGCSLPQGGSARSSTARQPRRLCWSFQGTLLWTTCARRLINLPDLILRVNKTSGTEASVILFGRCIPLRFDDSVYSGDSDWIYTVRLLLFLFT